MPSLKKMVLIKTKKKWKKSSPELVEVFNRLTSSLSDVEHRQMFGYPCCFHGGHLFCGLHEEHLILRLSGKDRERFLTIIGARQFEPMKNRIMKEYVEVPKEMLTQTRTLNNWLKKSLSYVKDLPPKNR